MMTRMKGWLACVLAASMGASLVAMPAFASANETVSEIVTLENGKKAISVGGEPSWGHALRELEIYNEPAQGYAKDYDILVSSDSVNWSSVATVTDAYGEPAKIIDFTPVTARYMKVDVTAVHGGATDSGHEIREMAVYDTGTINLARQAAVTYSETGYGAPPIHLKDGD